MLVFLLGPILLPLALMICVPPAFGMFVLMGLLSVWMFAPR